MKVFEITFKMFNSPMCKKEKVFCSSKKKLTNHYKEFSLIYDIREIKKEEFLVL